VNEVVLCYRLSGQVRQATLRGAAGDVIGTRSSSGSVGRRLPAVFAVEPAAVGGALALERHLLSVLSSLRSWRKTSLVMVASILGELAALEAVLQRTVLL